MRIDFVNEIARALRIERKELIEKDVIMHEILADMSSNKFMRSSFVFKGGTCLAKSYLGYLRFSEDIDFTWRKQSVFKGKSQNKIRAKLSKVIDTTGETFEEIARKRGLDFKCDKGDRHYFEFGGGNKTCTLKIWYESEVMKRNTFLKVQVNFVEEMCYPVKKLQLKSLIEKGSDELRTLFPEHAEYLEGIPFYVYDAREILSEKVRAILTREGTKARDFVDVYFISKRLGISPMDVEGCTLKKTEFVLNLYEKYRQNFKAKMKLLDSGELFEWGEERALLLAEIDENDLYLFLNGFQKLFAEMSLEDGR